VLNHPSLTRIYGVSSVDQLLGPSDSLAELMTVCSPIVHVTADDPPLIMFHPKSGKSVAHSIVFGLEMKKALDLHEVEALLNPVRRDEMPEAIVEFFAEAFGPKTIGGR